MLNIPLDNINRHFSVLEKIGNLGSFRGAGFLRASWSDEETAAMEYIKTVGQDAGMRAVYDGVGNLYLTTPGPASEVVQVGSHLDTVPQGGLFDGGAGIVAGLEAMLALREYWSNTVRRLQLVVWRGEESATFGAVCKGSQAAFGQNDPNILLKQFEGRTLEQAIQAQGFDPSYIAQQQPALSPQQIDAIAAYLELHIEQARRLEINQNDIGIVTSVRGTIRFRVVVIGEAAHSGGTPMGVTYRKDANLAMAYMQVELDRLAHKALTEGHDLVQTIGVLNTDRDFNTQNPQIYENSMTKVSPYGYFTIDIRSNNLTFLENYAAQTQAVIEGVGPRFAVLVKVQRIGFLPPIEVLDGKLQELAEDACRRLKYPYEMMPSGAIHDVAVVAAQKRSDGTAISGALIFYSLQRWHQPQSQGVHLRRGRSERGNGFGPYPACFSQPTTLTVGSSLIVLRAVGRYVSRFQPAPLFCHW